MPWFSPTGLGRCVTYHDHTQSLTAQKGVAIIFPDQNSFTKYTDTSCEEHWALSSFFIYPVNESVVKWLRCKSKLVKETMGVTNDNLCHSTDSGHFSIPSLVNRTETSFGGCVWTPQCLDVTLGRRLLSRCASSCKDEGWWLRASSINNLWGH